MEVLKITDGREGLESKIIRRRPLGLYERQLGFNRSILEGQTVLNFGCGGSNLSGELRSAGSSACVVDLDLADNPMSEQADGRTFVQADGRDLPFADGAFDTALALFSTYQIPMDSQQQVFGELLRVSNAVHIAPVTAREYSFLKTASHIRGFDVVYSARMPSKYSFRHNNEITLVDTNSYNSLRPVTEPNLKAPFVMTLFGKRKRVFVRSGNLVILKKR